MIVSDLQPLAQRLVRSIKVADPLPIICISQENVEELSVPTSLQDLTSYIQEEPSNNVHEKIIYIEASLRNPHGVVQEKDTNEAASAIQEFTIAALTPPPSIFARKSAFSAALATFTDPRDPWTLPSAAETSTSLLKKILTPPSTLPQLLTTILSTRIKPLFPKSQRPSLTSQARKAAFPLPSPAEHSADEVALKPWKFTHVYIITVFGWVLARLTPAALEQHWPLVIPPLLTILDDEVTENKIRGCELLNVFLGIVPPELLRRTGLGEVFGESLMPCLGFLPTLTPEGESLRLLGAVYPTLLALLRRRYPREREREGVEKGRSEIGVDREKIRDLDKILRVGVLNGYAHAGENVRIATLLVSKATDVVDEMGIYCVKHLKDLIPLLSNILSAPFALAHPPLLEAAAHTLQALMINGWPRISHYHGEILKGITACWCMIKDEGESEKLKVLCIVLRQDMELLRAALGVDTDMVREIDALLDGEPRLNDLLTFGK